MLFCDTKFNITRDETEFKNQSERKIKAKITITSKTSFDLSLYDSQNHEFFFKEIKQEDFVKGERINVLVKDNAIYWDDEPKDNFHVKFEKDSSYIYFIENCSNIFDVNFCPTIQIYRTKSTDELIIKMNIFTYYVGNIDVLTTNKALFEVVREYDPEYNDESTKRTDKKRIWTLTEPRDSLPYLEFQIDLLSKFMFIILRRYPAVKQELMQIFPNLDEIEQALEISYVTNIKSPKDCLDEIIEYKNKMRNIQREYYQNIGKKEFKGV